MYNITIQFRDGSLESRQVEYWHTLGNAIIFETCDNNNSNYFNSRVVPLDLIKEMSSVYEYVPVVK
jgi:hypothetical protein